MRSAKARDPLQTLEQLLAEVPVFGGLQPGHLELITGCGANERVEPTPICSGRESRADRFYRAPQRPVALEVNAPGRGPLELQTVDAGEVLGWSWLFLPIDGSSTRARWSRCGIAFDGTCLRGKCEADHELGYELMRRFAADDGDACRRPACNCSTSTAMLRATG